MKRLFVFLILPCLTLSCKSPDDPVTPSGSDAPKEITLSMASIEAPAEGDLYSLTVTSPARPKLEFPVTSIKWLGYQDGTYNDKTYRITFKISVEANDTYEARSADITVSAKGVPSVTLRVSQEGKEVIKDPELPDNDAVAMARKLGFGWNIGNQMEAHNNGFPSEVAWTGTLCTQATFTKVRAAGIASVRIPVTWIDKIGPAPDYTLDPTRLERLKEVVGYAREAGLNTIINIHHDGADSQYWLSLKQGADNTAILAEIAAVWKQLAEAFRDEGDYLIFESFNEPHDGGWGWSAEYRTAEGRKRQNDILNGWNQKFVDVVRATGGNNSSRWLGVPGYAASPEFTLNDGFILPDDPAGKIMVAVHTYGPYEFGQTAAVNQWGHTRTVKKDDPSYDEDFYRTLFNSLYTRWVANNIPVYFGEYGCANRTDDKGYAFQLYFLEYLSKCAHVFGMPAFIWDNGAKGSGNEIYGIFDHGTGEYMDPVRGPEIIATCLKGLTDGSEAYTLQSVYDKAPQP